MPVTYALSSRGEEQRDVRHVLRLAEPTQERPLAHLRDPNSSSSSSPRVALLSIKPGEIELTRIPCSLPSIASWRVIPMIAALFVVWASDGKQLEAERAVQGGHVHDDAAAGLQVRPGGAGEVEDEVDLVLPRGSPVLVGEVLEPVEVRPGGEVEQHVDPAELAHRQLDELRALGRDR